jgi:aspartyl protease family protein
MSDKPMKRDPQGRTLRFALALLGLCVAATLGMGYMLRHDRILFPSLGTSPRPTAPGPPPAQRAAAGSAAHNQLVYRADGSGHFYVEAAVNGTPIRFLVDTGATVVALSPEDARAAGLSPASLSFSERMSTAHGEARAARARLREVRLGQLAVEQVAAVVMEQPMAVSLLGMSFLSRLDGYTIRDGVLTMDW